LINTARGGLIRESELARALAEGVIAGAALDALSVEPPPAGHPLTAAPNLIVTPHLAWTSLAARKRLLETTVANVRGILAGNPVNAVN
jgi:glycerate dehydrogenase